MGLSKLGQFIEQSELRNHEGLFDETAVVGLATSKQMIKTKADLDGVSLLSYKLLPPDHIAYVPDTTRRGDKMSLGYNKTEQTFLVSSISIVFKVSDTENLNSDYLFMYFNRPEFDRYARFHSWGSAREAFSWDDMCDIEIELPSLHTQKKYADVYNAMLANQQVYEKGLEDLRLACDAYIERLRNELPHIAIGDYIELNDERNTLKLGVESVRGLATSKELIATKADMEGVELTKYKTLRPKNIAYVADTTRRGDKISLALNSSNDIYLVSSISIVFSTNEKLLPEYLMLFLSRTEFDRYTRFHSWGSAREAFSWDDMCEVKIPIPDINVQQAIVNIYNAYLTRREINEKLKAQIKDICPILIKGSLENAGA
jgi:type I restriction enzyme S subunit